MKDVPNTRFRFTIEAEIRAARKEDLEALEWLGLYAGHRDIIRATFLAQERGDALMLLAVTAGFPIAQVWIDFVREAGGGAAMVWAVRTFYPLQGHGIGERMMAAAEEAIRRRGVGRAVLGVEADNPHGARFYRRLGWRAFGTREESVRAFSETGDPRELRLHLNMFEKML